MAARQVRERQRFHRRRRWQWIACVCAARVGVGGCVREVVCDVCTCAGVFVWGGGGPVVKATRHVGSTRASVHDVRSPDRGDNLQHPHRLITNGSLPHGLPTHHCHARARCALTNGAPGGVACCRTFPPAILRRAISAAAWPQRLHRTPSCGVSRVSPHTHLPGPRCCLDGREEGERPPPPATRVGFGAALGGSWVDCAFAVARDSA